MKFSLRTFLIIFSLLGLTLGLCLRSNRVHYTTVAKLHENRGEILQGGDLVGQVRVVTAWGIPPQTPQSGFTTRGIVNGKVYSISDKDLADPTCWHRVILLEEKETGKVSWLVIKMPEK